MTDLSNLGNGEVFDLSALTCAMLRVYLSTKVWPDEAWIKEQLLEETTMTDDQATRCAADVRPSLAGGPVQQMIDMLLAMGEPHEVIMDGFANGGSAWIDDGVDHTNINSTFVDEDENVTATIRDNNGERSVTVKNGKPEDGGCSITVKPTKPGDDA